MKIYTVTNNSGFPLNVGPWPIAPGNFINIYMTAEQAAKFSSGNLLVQENQSATDAYTLEGGVVNFSAPRQFKAQINNRTIAFLGDSVSAQALGGSEAAGYQYSSVGYATWVAYLSNRRVEPLPTSNFGVSGDTTARIKSRLPNLIKSRPGLCIVLAGTNDIGIDVNITINNLNDIYNALSDAGITVIALAILPRGNITTEQYGRIHQVNKWITAQRYKRSNFYVVDTTIPMATPATGIPKTDYVNPNPDLLHPTSRGAFYIAREVVKIVNLLYPDPQVPFANAADVYHAQYNPLGNLIANGVMSGTTGTLSNGPTGQLATSWSANGINLPAGVTTAMAKVTQADGREFQQVTFGGNYNSASPASLNVTASISPSNLAIGDVLEAMCEFEMDAGNQNLAAHQLVLAIDYATGTDPSPIDMVGNNTHILPAIAYGGILKTPKVKLTAVPSSISLQMRFTPKSVTGASDMAGVARFGSASVCKTPY